MSKNYQIILQYKRDAWGYQSESLKTPDGEEIFSVQDLSECPEDAIIGRDLFDAQDFISALRYGMTLVKEGYSDIIVKYEEEEQEE